MFLILTFGPSSMLKVRCTSFGPPGSSSISCVTSANWNPFSLIMSRTMPSTFFRRAGVDERVEADLRRSQFLERLVDLGVFELLGAGVVDDLHPLPLLHVVE